MTSRILATTLTCIGLAALCFAAGSLWQRERTTAAAPAPVQHELAGPDSRTARFAADSPQLQFIKTEQVVALPEPLLDPLNGRVAYDENYTARVTSPIAGRVTRIEVQPGDRVGAGSPLAWIDAPDYATASADLGKAQADVQQRTRAYARAKELLEGGVVPRKDVESSETDLRQAQTELRRADLRLRNLTAGTRAPNDGKLSLRSPIAGVVADRKLNPGAEVRPDAPDPLFIITDPAHVWVIVELPERFLGKVAVGQTVSVETDAYAGVDINGRIASIGQVLDPATRRVQVRCVVNNPRQLLKPEMFARVIPLRDEREKLVRVPNTALISQGLYSFVYVETQPGAFEKRKVTLGLQGRDQSYVRAGLVEGERVVASGTLLLESELASRN
ncbi:MAG TPA: efflux RND transporter periplasmic adaptor subunit [Burkholderiales bacterium]|nr:efflux RND transporter periplasmic adaptor subunit [Burkholderiales bacterium]